MSSFAAIQPATPGGTNGLFRVQDARNSEEVRPGDVTTRKTVHFGTDASVATTGSAITVGLQLEGSDEFKSVEIDATDLGSGVSTTYVFHRDGINYGDLQGLTAAQVTAERDAFKNAGFDYSLDKGTMNIRITPGNRINNISFRVEVNKESTGFRHVFVNDLRNAENQMDQKFVFAQTVGTARGSLNRLESVKKFNPRNVWREMSGAKFTIINPGSASGFNPSSRPDAITLRLPSDFNWVTSGDTRTRVFFNTVEFDLTAATSQLSTDGRTLTIFPTGRDGSLALPTGVILDRATVQVNPVFSTSRDVRLGQEVTVFVDSAKVNDSIVIAEFNDFVQGIKVEDVRELVAGRQSETSDQRIKVTIEDESVAFSSLSDIDVTFANGTAKLVRATGVDAVKVDGFRQGSRVPVGIENRSVNGDLLAAQYADTFQFATERNANNEVTNVTKIELEFYLRADNNAGGKDMTLNVSGRGLEHKDVKVASVIAPVEMTVSEVKNIELGLQAQEAGDIVITETVAGGLRRGEEYRIALNDTDSESATGRIKMLDGYKVEVAEGNGLNIRHSIQGNELVFTVLRESINTPAKITISDIRLTTDRTVAYGDIKAELVPAATPRFESFNLGLNTGNGYQFINTGTTQRDVFVDRAKTIFASTKFMKLATEAPTTVRQTTVFTIGSTAFTVGGEPRNLDAAPYISNNRTMLPIGTIAQLVGATVNYDSVTRTAVFQNDRTTVSMNLDTNILMVNGSPVPMDTKPEIQQSRAFVSLVYVAQAFGIQNGTDIVYNATDRTVTMFPGVQ